MRLACIPKTVLSWLPRFSPRSDATGRRRCRRRTGGAVPLPPRARRTILPWQAHGGPRLGPRDLGECIKEARRTSSMSCLRRHFQGEARGLRAGVAQAPTQALFDRLLAGGPSQPSAPRGGGGGGGGARRSGRSCTSTGGGRGRERARPSLPTGSCPASPRSVSLSTRTPHSAHPPAWTRP